MSSILAVAKKELRQISRDYRTLGFILIIPAFLLLMYGFALNFDIKHIRLAVCDQDKSASSRKFVEEFTNTEYFDLEYAIDDPREIDGLMGEEKIKAALVIPSDFTRRLIAGREAEVQFLVDGTNSTSAATAAGYISGIVQGYSVRMTVLRLEERGLKAIAQPLKTDMRVWYNPELRSSNFLIPGLMAFILNITIVVSMAFSIVREKERGTMEQILVSPLKPIQLIIGKTVPYVAISFVSAHIVLLLGHVLFGVALKGNYLYLFLIIVLFLIGGLGQGLLISSVTRTQQVAFQLAMLTTNLPSFILSGFVFPIRNMPPVVQAFTYFVPAKYFLVALRSIMLKGAGLSAFWVQILFLMGFAFLTIFVSTARLRASETGEVREKARCQPGRRRPG